MPWLILITSAVFEAVWAVALGLSDGFTVLAPTVVFALALPVSLFGLAYAVKHIPISTGYAVWTGVGAALTVIYSMATGMESASPAKIVFLLGIIGAVIGLKLLPHGECPVEEEKTTGHL